MKFLLVAFYLLLFFLCVAQHEQLFQEGFFEFGTGKVHYLDFGGQGLPVVFIPSNDRAANTFKDFAPRFSDEFRVFAITLPGSGKSDGAESSAFSNFDLKASVVIALLDNLNLERAVFIDRHFHVPVYLAERYPERVAGLVMMNGFPPDPFSFYLEEMMAEDKTKIIEMTEVLNQSQIEDLPEHIFEPEYIKTGQRIDVSLLMIRHHLEAPLWERDFKGILEMANWVEKNPNEFPEKTSREYFQKLAKDSLMQEEVKDFFRTTIQDYYEITAAEFYEVFGGSLQIVELKGEEDYGYYHYLSAPDLIEQPIRDFLKQINKQGKMSK